MHKTRFESIARSLGYQGELVNTLQVYCHWHGTMIHQLSLAPAQYHFSNHSAKLIAILLLKCPQEISADEVDIIGDQIEKFVTSLNVDEGGWTPCSMINCVRAHGLALRSVLRTGVQDWPIRAPDWTSKLVHPNDEHAQAKFGLRTLEAVVHNIRTFSSNSESVVAQFHPGQTLGTKDIFHVHELIRAVHKDTEDAMAAYERGRQDEREKGKA